MHRDKHGMKKVNPLREPNRWLELTILNLIEEDSKENEQALKAAIHAITHWLEPGVIDQLFGHWMEDYLDALSEYENKKNNVDPPCSYEGP
jgi:hypothetical protein